MNNMNFDSERQYFQQFKSNLTDEAREEYESSIKTLITRYNTSFRANRFIVGGVLEVFTAALMRASGVDVRKIGTDAVGGDLMLPDSKILSLKSSFTGSAVKLINTMDNSGTEWTIATLFIMAKMGIVYGDPLMAKEDDLRRPKDGLTILKGAINRFGKDETNLILMNIPVKPPKPSSQQNGDTDVEASIARKIASDLSLTQLSNYL